jgi:hypothetical protein
MFLYELKHTNINTKIEINVIHLLENDFLPLKFKGSSIFDFGKIFPKHYNSFLTVFQMNNINYMKIFVFLDYKFISF